MHKIQPQLKLLFCEIQTETELVVGWKA